MNSKLTLGATLEGQRRTWPLEADVVQIGRSSRCPVHLPDATVSKTHAEIVRAGDGWLIRDLGSRNGTRENAVDAVEPTAIRDGDLLEIGKVMVRVGPDVAADTTGFAVRDLSSSFRRSAQDLLTRPATGGGSPRTMKLLAEAGQLLVLPRPLRETCEEILSFLERALPAQRLVLLLRDQPDAEPTPIASRVRGGRPGEPLAISQSILRVVLDECTSVATNDAARDPRFEGQKSIVSQGVHSAMAAPLFDNTKVLGALYADSRLPGFAFDEEQLQLFTILANMAAVKITNARLLEAEQGRLRIAQELATATRIQRGLLPRPPEDVSGWQFHARLETCYEVGGDLYDFHRRLDGGLVLMVGDVSGKGLGASLLMSSVLASARVLYDFAESPLPLAIRLNQMVCRNAAPGQFVTVFLAFIDPASGRVRFVNAGHNPPVLVRRGELSFLEDGGVPLGVLPSFPFQEGEATLEPGDLLAAFSDGIPEAARGEEFFDDIRLREALVEMATDPELDRVGDGIVSRVEQFLAGAPRSDDITLVLVRRS
jgi:serine phosphatase RsbU (regulator of sigma subunit)